MAPTSPATRTRKPRAKKPEGQWKIDGTKPLNHEEELKQEEAAFAVKQRVIDTYSKEGFDSIPAEDLAPRFKWLGIYTQRRQDLGGEYTKQIDNSEMQDHYFMMRVRIDGGQLNPERVRTIGEISRDFARSTADLTDRQNVQLHWIEIEDVPEIWERLEAVGLTTIMACGDVPRVIMGSPAAGIAADEVIDATPAIDEIHEKYLGDEDLANLPRKYKTGISGNARQDVNHEIQDIGFVASVHPEHGPGFECFVGGGLSTNPMIGQPLGAWMPLERVAEVWHAVALLFRDYGFRRLRNRARIKFLVKEWGIEKFRRILEDEYLDEPLIDGPKVETRPGGRDHIGVHEQKDGRFYLGVKPTVGHLTGEQLIEIADIAEAHGVERIRTTNAKELLFLDVEREEINPLSRDLAGAGLYPQPSEFRRGIMTCTGLEFCKLAYTTTKAYGIELVDELEERIGDLDTPITIGINGCPNACARTQVSDIGLKGQVVTDDDGNKVEGFQVHLGGSMSLDQNFGRKLKGHKVLATELNDYVARVVGNFKEKSNDGELFREWVARAPEDDLR